MLYHSQEHQKIVNSKKQKRNSYAISFFVYTDIIVDVKLDKFDDNLIYIDFLQMWKREIWREKKRK